MPPLFFTLGGDIMARPVKCFVTGEHGYSDVFIKHENHYYKSEEVYQEYKKEMEFRTKIIDLIVYDYMAFPKDFPFPTILTKRLREIEHFGYETIYRTLIGQDATIRRILPTKTFDSEYLKMMYILAIVKNNIFPTWKIVLAEKREAKKNQKPVQDTTIQDIQEINNPKQNVKNISKFLED